MGTAERRRRIIKILIKKRRTTINELSYEFGVSERTIRRDIDVLSIDEPIYTQPGRYNGGVYIVDGYCEDNDYFNDDQQKVFEKILHMDQVRNNISENEFILLKGIFNNYIKPTIKKSGGYYDKD